MVVADKRTSIGWSYDFADGVLVSRCRYYTRTHPSLPQEARESIACDYYIDGLDDPISILRTDFIRRAHEGMCGWHLGVKRTLDQIQRRGYWRQ